VGNAKRKSTSILGVYRTRKQEVKITQEIKQEEWSRHGQSFRDDKRDRVVGEHLITLRAVNTNLSRSKASLAAVERGIVVSIKRERTTVALRAANAVCEPEHAHYNCDNMLELAVLHSESN